MNSKIFGVGQPATYPARHSTLSLLLAMLLVLGATQLAYADRNGGRDGNWRRDDHSRRDRHDRHDFQPYHARYWTLDTRFNHNHYYPALGYSVRVLPPGYMDINIGSGHLFFSAGVWFRPEGLGYVVAPPPYGARLPILPPDYATIWVGDTPYFYANGIYYVSAPRGGYVVAAPPPEAQVVMPPPSLPPPNVASTPVGQAGDGLVIYPKSGQSPSQMAADRAECTRWATGQTGFDPSTSAIDDARRPDFLRAASACLEAHDYSVK